MSFPGHLKTAAYHLIVHNFAEQLKARAENEAQLKHLKADLEKDLQCKEAALQTAVEEVKARFDTASL